ncbi:hypothetical protein AUJ46_05085 [Candidatus Peregrinibacteria bacterium CG1_02_54_53]|nr:MAG: hypothetical protein AUJ46_05085 [Candidatus Peregrinibacteria bacterium CG1_02_54_53]
MLPLTPYQIIAPLISLFAILYVWSLVFKQKKTIWEGSLWTLFWMAIAVIALFPPVLDYLAFVMGFKDRQNALLITFLGVLSFIVFYLIVRLEELEQRQTKLTRSMALKDAGLDHKRTGSPEGKAHDQGR